MSIAKNIKKLYQRLFVRERKPVPPAAPEPTLQDNLNLAMVVYRTGKTEQELISMTYYFKMSLTDLVDYYIFFGRLPEPDYATVIRHFGVPELISQVSRLSKTVNN